MVSKEDAKKEVNKLIEKYNRVIQSGSKYNEEMTKKDFILPLFRALGWDIEDSNEVTAEESLLKGAVDYAFLINKNYKFFVEAKPLGSDLRKYAQQAIAYGVNSSSTWVILTNFESIIVFNCEWQEKDWWKNTLFEQLGCKDYIEQIDLLWLLSKEGTINDALEKYAASKGKRIPRTPIDKELLSKLLQYRMKLSKEISKISKYNETEIDELVQRLLIRLLFIRNCEDRGFETKYKLLSIVEGFKTHKRGLSKFLRAVFNHYNSRYNGSIFKEAEIDKIRFDEKLLAEIIEGFYYTTDRLKYNFNIIPADVMGNLYEQYLGHILKKTSQSAKLKEGKVHRKEQGIYYTPTYIVDYIVRNTLGELLKGKKVDASKIRILDPACGSGSFLVKAFDVLNEHYAKDKESYGQKTLAGNDITYSAKERILKNNIFGVDLDKQAAEIARLNLLLRIAAQEQKLPLLEQNIRIGNSLIDNPAIAGDKAFKWEEQFAEIIKDGGFDVVIGNPPYVRPENVDKNERDYYLTSGKFDKFFGRFDVYILFIERALKLLKPDGYFSFIIPYSFLNQNYSKVLREWILKDFKILFVVDLSQVKVFESAEVNTCILVIQKSKPKKGHDLKIVKPLSLSELYSSNNIILKQEIFMTTPQFMIRTDLNNDKIEIINKMTKESIFASEIFYTVIGSVPHDSKTGASKDRLISSVKSNDSFKKYIEGKDMSRYGITWRAIYLNYQPKMMHRPKFPELFENEKLIVRNISTKEGLLAVYDADNYFTNDTVSLCVPWYKLENVTIKGEKISKTMIENSKKYNLKYCLGIINSKILNFYFKHILSSNLHVYPEAIRNLPIKAVPESQQRPIIKLVDKMLSLNKRLNELGDKKTDERARLEEEIKKTDTEIDELVYKIYGITEEERKVIEESLK